MLNAVEKRGKLSSFCLSQRCLLSLGDLGRRSQNLPEVWEYSHTSTFFCSLFDSLTTGGAIMSLFPLADCARLLGIHPKTLRQ